MPEWPRLGARMERRIGIYKAPGKTREVMRASLLLLVALVGLAYLPSELASAETVSSDIAIVYPHAETPRENPYPLYVGAEWIYGNPSSYRSTLLISKVLANVYCIDPEAGVAWECFAVRMTDSQDFGAISYLHRRDNGVYRFSRILNDQAIEFPGYLFMPYPYLLDTYLAYNVPRSGHGVLWDRAVSCVGDWNLLSVGNEGDCPVGSEVVVLSILHRRETVGLPWIVNSMSGAYATVFTEAWKLELYDGIGVYPDYRWYSTSSELAWLAPGIGVVKWVGGSNFRELAEFVHQDEVLSLSPMSESKWHDCAEHSLVVLQFRGSDPEGSEPTSWRVVEIEGQRPTGERDEIFTQIGEPAFYHDISKSGQPLSTGTYVFTFKAARQGLGIFRFVRSDADDDSDEEVFRVKVEDSATAQP